MPDRRDFILGAANLATLSALGPLDALAAEAPLLQRRIPSSGEMLPAIGLGTSQVFEVSLTDAELAPLAEVVKTLFEGGAKVIDTAPSYGPAEEVTGELLKRDGSQARAFIATKVSVSGRDRGLAQFRESQKVLRREKIDLVQVHNLRDTATQLSLLRELQQQGVIRYIGITHYVEGAHDELVTTLEREKGIDFVQFNYSVGERGAEKRLLPYCRDHGLATLINRPFQRASLLSRVKDRPLPGFATELLATSWAQLALKFILAEPAVTVVIPATSKAKYMTDNLAAGRGSLPDAAQRKKIIQAFV